MEVREIKDKQIWEDFLLNCKEKTFLNSWNWAEFNKTMGDKIWRLGIYLPAVALAKKDGEEQLLSVALVIKIKAKRGTFLFLPHSPVISSPGKERKKDILKILLQELKKLAKQEKASFIRIAPTWQRTSENEKIFQKLGFRQAPIHMHPELTWQLDIRPSEQELLTKMRKTTRYLIKKGMKNKDIRIEKSKNIKDVEKFNKLYQETVKRHNFTPFSLNYLQNEFKAFDQNNEIVIFLGYHKDKLIASAMIIYWQNMAFYHQGASIQSDIPVSYVLQWEAIKQAKQKGCQIYNFWGVAPADDKNHPWHGLSLFKTGFGGEKKEYVKTQDFVLGKTYWLNFIIEIIRKKKRGV